MDQAEREKREAARGANSNQPRYWIRTFPFLTPFHPLFPVPLLSLPIFRSLCYSATLLFSKAGPLIPSNPRATNPSRSTVIIVSREKTTLSLSLSLSRSSREEGYVTSYYSREMFCENWFLIYMGYGYGLVKLEGEFRLFQFFAFWNEW